MKRSEPLSPGAEIFQRTTGWYQARRYGETTPSPRTSVERMVDVFTKGGIMVGSQLLSQNALGFAEFNPGAMSIPEVATVGYAKLHLLFAPSDFGHPELTLPVFLIGNTLINLAENAFIVLSRRPRKRLRQFMLAKTPKFLKGN